MTILVSWPGGSWEATLRATIIIAVLYLSALWLTLIFWTYRDIRQRTRDPIVQTVAVMLVLVFFLPGHWLYLILRPRYTLSELYERSLEEEALLQELEDQKACPTCKRRIQDDFLICPSCRTQLKEPCRQCSKPLSYAWMACPFCGLEKPPREIPRPARPPGMPVPQGRQGNRRPSRGAPPSRPAPAQAMTAPARDPFTPPADTPPPAPSREPFAAAAPSTPPPAPSRDPFAPARPQPRVEDGPVIGSTE